MDDPRFHHLIPMHRPQEALTARAAQAMVRTLNSLRHGPRSEADIELVITTGDAIDNAQWNELRMFLALLEGGLVRPGSGGPRYEGVQSLQWGDDSFWRPDGDETVTSDWYQRRHGSPTYQACSSRPSPTSTRVGCDCPGWPASATTRFWSKASAG